MSGTLPEIKGETVGATQSVSPGCDWSAEHVSQTGNLHAERSTHRRLDRRTVVKIQGKVVKQRKRNALYRFVVSKTDKDKIAAWKQDFIRVLHVFNVRAIRSVGHSFANLTTPFQTELAIDTNMTVTDTKTIVTDTKTIATDTKTIATDTKTVVTDTQTMVADMHRNMLTEREGSSGKNHSVGTTCSIHPQRNAYHPLESNQVSDTEHYGVRSLTFL
jgi:hypothetical protein